MSGGLEDDYKVGKYNVDLDLTEVFENLADAQGKQREKYLLHILLSRFSGHEVEYTRVLSEAFPEMVKVMPKFFQKRVEDHRDSMRISKVFSFRSASSIEEEATRRAWEDTRAMMKEMLVVNNESIKGLVDTHRDVLKNLSDAIISLVMQKEGTEINLDVEAIKKFLKG